VRISTRSIFSLVVAGAVTGGTLACSLALDFLQCRDDADCVNAAGADLVCSDNECIVPPEPSTVSCAAASECVDALGDNHVCNGGTCAALTSEECTEAFLPSGADPNSVVWVGSVLATSSPFDEIGLPLQNAVRLAVSDFNSVATVGGNEVGVIFCDTQGSTSVAEDAVDHLIAAGVQVIVGPTFSEEVLAVTDAVVDAGVFMISPTASSKDITDLDDNGLVWRTISSDVHQAAGLTDLVSELDPDPSTVVLLVKDDNYGNGILSDVTEPLVARIPGLVTLKYSDPASFSSNDDLLAEYGNRIATAISAEPDTVVVIGTSEARELILFYLDSWADLPGPPTLPRFIVTHGGVLVMEDIIAAVAESFRPALMAKVQGVAPIVQDDDNFAEYNIRYKIRFDDEQPLTISSLSYDAAMVSLLAMAGAGASPTGSTVAEQMARLVDPAGTALRFGGAGVKFVSDGVTVLNDGGTLDLQGVSGPLDFNLTTGEVRVNLVNWGLVPRDSTNQARLDPLQNYILDAPPAVSGTWTPLE